MFFQLERKNFRSSAFRGIRLFAHVLIFFVRKHFSKTPGVSISPDSCILNYQKHQRRKDCLL